jgi:hypothetical protein
VYARGGAAGNFNKFPELSGPALNSLKIIGQPTPWQQLHEAL